MTAMHHPTATRLLAYAAGTLDAGQRLVLAAHLDRCSSCRKEVAAFEDVAGALLVDLPPTPMTSGALERMQARLESPDAADPIPRPVPVNDMPELPERLRCYQLGRWRWAGRGLRWRALTLPVESGSRVFLLKGQPGTRLPRHSHSDTEITLVLKGSFSHERGRFAAGDIDDSDESVEHQPVVSSDEECICLIAMEGDLVFSGLLGRIMQPLVP
jgi:putative transcriptional regulator